jgi:hypothetical protein
LTIGSRPGLASSGSRRRRQFTDSNCTWPRDVSRRRPVSDATVVLAQLIAGPEPRSSPGCRSATKRVGERSPGPWCRSPAPGSLGHGHPDDLTLGVDSRRADRPARVPRRPSVRPVSAQASTGSARSPRPTTTTFSRPSRREVASPGRPVRKAQVEGALAAAQAQFGIDRQGHGPAARGQYGQVRLRMDPVLRRHEPASARQQAHVGAAVDHVTRGEPDARVVHRKGGAYAFAGLGGTSTSTWGSKRDGRPSSGPRPVSARLLEGLRRGLGRGRSSRRPRTAMISATMTAR